MKLKKPLIVAGITSGVALASLVGVSAVSAATTGTTTNDDHMSSLIDKIASKFNLKKDDLKAVFDEARTEREAAQQKKVETELEQLVTDGKITTAQKDLLLAKRAEVQKQRETNHDALKDKTEDERHTAIEAERTALEKWASDNGIAKEYLRYVFGGHGFHHGHGGPDGPPAADSSASNQ